MVVNIFLSCFCAPNTFACNIFALTQSTFGFNFVLPRKQKSMQKYCENMQKYWEVMQKLLIKENHRYDPLGLWNYLMFICLK